MAQTFLGEAENKIDDKGRTSVPALFRPTLVESDPRTRDGERPRVMMVYGNPENAFLECYSVEAMEELKAKINALPLGHPAREAMSEMYLGKVHVTEVDKDGRLVIPKFLRDAFGLEGQIQFISSGVTFRIWNVERYAAQSAGRTRAWLDSLPPGTNPLAVLDNPELL